MPKPLPPEKRQAIEQAIRDGHSRNHIARTHAVAGSTVTKIAKELETQGDLDQAPAFDRSQTAIATAARQVDVAARRAELAELLIEDAHWLRNLARTASWPVVVGGVKSPRVLMVGPNTLDLRNLYQALGVAVDKSRALTEDDGPEKEAASLMKGLVDEIRARRADRAAE